MEVIDLSMVQLASEKNLETIKGLETRGYKIRFVGCLNTNEHISPFCLKIKRKDYLVIHSLFFERKSPINEIINSFWVAKNQPQLPTT